MLSKEEPALPQAPVSWRAVLPIHPAAELLPRMSPDELAALAEDIRKHGLRDPVVVQRQYRRREGGTVDIREFDLVVIDGRSRLDAMETAGFVLVRDGKLDPDLGHKALGLEPLTRGGYAELDDDVDIYAFVISRNIHRRHLTAEQRRDLIAKLIKAEPGKSDRQIGEMVRADHKTVGAVRAQKEATGEVSPVEKRVGKDGKARKHPAKKPKRATEPPPKVSGEVLQQRAAAKPARDNIGPGSKGEIARKDAELEELRNAKRRLEIENTGLRSEALEASDKRIEQLITDRRKYADAPLPPLNLARLPLQDQLILLIGLLQDGLAPVRKLVAALELPETASLKRRSQLDGIEAMVGAVFNWMSTTQEHVAEIKQALDDYAAAATAAPPAAEGLDDPATAATAPLAEDYPELPPSLRRAAP